MNPIYGRALIFFGLVLTILIRIPHDKKSAAAKVSVSKKSKTENLLLLAVAIGIMLLPILAIFTPVFSFADYPLSPMAFGIGSFLLLLNLWLFFRSHADLGTNWSKTLELRENHKLVTNGIYQKIRHPMYGAIYLYALAQAFLLSNWVAGSAGFIAFTFMYFLRVRAEEQMMEERFGEEYFEYKRRTKRLIPGIY